MKMIRCVGIARPSLVLAHLELPVITLLKPRLISFQIRCSVTDTTLSVPSSRRQKKPSPSSLFTHPSLVQISSDKTANRASVYDFLRGIGIVPDELDGLELPVTVEVMRERVDFLHTLGLTIEDINNYPLVLGCSVKKNMVPVLDYLGKIGVRKSTLTQFLRRYPQVLHSSVVVDLAPVVKYLQGMDIKLNDIPRVLEMYPELLGFKLEGTMSTSVAYLVGIGVARREIGGVLTRYPEILGMRVGRTIKPLVEYLVSLGIPQLAIARLVEKRPQILGFGLEERVKPNVRSLLEFSVRETMLGSVIAQYPQIIGLDLHTKLSSQREFLHSIIELDSVSYGRAVEKMPEMISLSHAPVVKRVEYLKKCGFSVEQISKMVLGCPQILALNLDIMKRSFDYFQGQMGRPLDDLVSFPAFFTYGLESTIRPRHTMVAKKGLKCSLAWLLNCSDVKFEERMTYDTIDMEEMDAADTASFDMNSLMDARDEDEDSDYEDESDSDS